jgi:hypothetical protein
VNLDQWDFRFSWRWVWRRLPSGILRRVVSHSPDDGGSKHFWNVGQRECTAQYPRSPIQFKPLFLNFSLLFSSFDGTCPRYASSNYTIYAVLRGVFWASTEPCIVSRWRWPSDCGKMVETLFIYLSSILRNEWTAIKREAKVKLKGPWSHRRRRRRRSILWRRIRSPESKPPRILDLDHRRRGIISFMLRLLYPRGKNSRYPYVITFEGP